ncbi:major facilitator superfamily domain-containing protein [Exophiala viscosa]|uniref:Major facilitator superfamily domain-containing protein n=1 Tax=Exophiala viscosa TaxID=2486360 RepID=A0AAN6E5H3_9EURO|nr:major facilitator superfamily domain-containing protein [Exophiala viscosa]
MSQPDVPITSDKQTAEAALFTSQTPPAQRHGEPKPKGSLWQKAYGYFTYTPKRCRYDPDKPFQFSMSLNLLFAFAGCFTVANLYYTHPILNLLAEDFHVTNEQSSYIPTLAQAGYAGGLLFLCPVGDLIKRRPFVLWLVWFTATLWIGLCITKSFAAFGAITFITSVTTVTPQLMLPLVGDMAPPHRRSTALSIVVSGMLLGMLMARLLSGVVAQFIGWRYIYWISFGLQYLILILLWLFMPDYPSKNPDEKILKKYPFLLWDIVKLVAKYPVLVQACLVGLFTATIFTSYWTTLTFLLAGAPYHYDSLVIGLFALIGIGSMTWGPIFARTFMEKHQPLLSVMIGEIICLAGVIVGTYTGKHTIAGPILQAVAIDIGLQTSQIANRTAIYAVAPLSRNRVNTAYMVSVFVGQLIGTAVGNRLYARGGWTSSGSASVGFVACALLVCFLRGPHEKGWIGWRGGYDMSKKTPKKPGPNDPENGPTQEGMQPVAQDGAEANQQEKQLQVELQGSQDVAADSSRSSQRTLGEEIQEEKR